MSGSDSSGGGAPPGQGSSPSERSSNSSQHSTHSAAATPAAPPSSSAVSPGKAATLKWDPFAVSVPAGPSRLRRSSGGSSSAAAAAGSGIQPVASSRAAAASSSAAMDGVLSHLNDGGAHDRQAPGQRPQEGLAGDIAAALRHSDTGASTTSTTSSRGPLEALRDELFPDASSGSPMPAPAAAGVQHGRRAAAAASAGAAPPPSSAPALLSSNRAVSPQASRSAAPLSASPSQQEAGGERVVAGQAPAAGRLSGGGSSLNSRTSGLTADADEGGGYWDKLMQEIDAVVPPPAGEALGTSSGGSSSAGIGSTGSFEEQQLAPVHRHASANHAPRMGTTPESPPPAWRGQVSSSSPPPARSDPARPPTTHVAPGPPAFVASSSAQLLTDARQSRARAADSRQPVAAAAAAVRRSPNSPVHAAATTAMLAPTFSATSGDDDDDSESDGGVISEPVHVPLTVPPRRGAGGSRGSSGSGSGGSSVWEDSAARSNASHSHPAAAGAAGLPPRGGSASGDLSFDQLGDDDAPLMPGVAALTLRRPVALEAPQLQPGAGQLSRQASTLSRQSSHGTSMTSPTASEGMEYGGYGALPQDFSFFEPDAAAPSAHDQHQNILAALGFPSESLRRRISGGGSSAPGGGSGGSGGGYGGRRLSSGGGSAQEGVRGGGARSAPLGGASPSSSSSNLSRGRFQDPTPPPPPAGGASRGSSGSGVIHNPLYESRRGAAGAAVEPPPPPRAPSPLMGASTSDPASAPWRAPALQQDHAAVAAAAAAAASRAWSPPPLAVAAASAVQGVGGDRDGGLAMRERLQALASMRSSDSGSATAPAQDPPADWRHQAPTAAWAPASPTPPTMAFTPGSGRMPTYSQAVSFPAEQQQQQQQQQRSARTSRSEPGYAPPHAADHFSWAAAAPANAAVAAPFSLPPPPPPPPLLQGRPRSPDLAPHGAAQRALSPSPAPAVAPLDVAAVLPSRRTSGERRPVRHASSPGSVQSSGSADRPIYQRPAGRLVSASDTSLLAVAQPWLNAVNHQASPLTRGDTAAVAAAAASVPSASGGTPPPWAPAPLAPSAPHGGGWDAAAGGGTAAAAAQPHERGGVGSSSSAGGTPALIHAYVEEQQHRKRLSQMLSQVRPGVTPSPQRSTLLSHLHDPAAATAAAHHHHPLLSPAAYSPGALAGNVSPPRRTSAVSVGDANDPYRQQPRITLQDFVTVPGAGGLLLCSPRPSGGGGGGGNGGNGGSPRSSSSPPSSASRRSGNIAAPASTAAGSPPAGPSVWLLPSPAMLTASNLPAAAAAWPSSGSMAAAAQSNNEFVSHWYQSLVHVLAGGGGPGAVPPATPSSGGGGAAMPPLPGGAERHLLQAFGSAQAPPSHPLPGDPLSLAVQRGGRSEGASSGHGSVASFTPTAVATAVALTVAPPNRRASQAVREAVDALFGPGPALDITAAAGGGAQLTALLQRLLTGGAGGGTALSDGSTSPRAGGGGSGGAAAPWTSGSAWSAAAVASPGVLDPPQSAAGSSAQQHSGGGAGASSSSVHVLATRSELELAVQRAVEAARAEGVLEGRAEAGGPPVGWPWGYPGAGRPDSVGGTQTDLLALFEQMAKSSGGASSASGISASVGAATAAAAAALSGRQHASAAAAAAAAASARAAQQQIAAAAAGLPGGGHHDRRRSQEVVGRPPVPRHMGGGGGGGGGQAVAAMPAHRPIKNVISSLKQEGYFVPDGIAAALDLPTDDDAPPAAPGRVAAELYGSGRPAPPRTAGWVARPRRPRVSNDSASAAATSGAAAAPPQADLRLASPLPPPPPAQSQPSGRPRSLNPRSSRGGSGGGEGALLAETSPHPLAPPRKATPVQQYPSVHRTMTAWAGDDEWDEEGVEAEEEEEEDGDIGGSSDGDEPPPVPPPPRGVGRAASPSAPALEMVPERNSTPVQRRSAAQLGYRPAAPQPGQQQSSPERMPQRSKAAAAQRLQQQQQLAPPAWSSPPRAGGQQHQSSHHHPHQAHPPATSSLDLGRLQSKLISAEEIHMRRQSREDAAELREWRQGHSSGDAGGVTWNRNTAPASAAGGAAGARRKASPAAAAAARRQASPAAAAGAARRSVSAAARRAEKLSSDEAGSDWAPGQTGTAAAAPPRTPVQRVPSSVTGGGGGRYEGAGATPKSGACSTGGIMCRSTPRGGAQWAGRASSGSILDQADAKLMRGSGSPHVGGGGAGGATTPGGGGAPSSLRDSQHSLRGPPPSEYLEVGRPAGWQERETRHWLYALGLAPSAAEEAAPFLDNPLRNGTLLCRIALVVAAAAEGGGSVGGAPSLPAAPRDMKSARANILYGLDGMGLLAVSPSAVPPAELSLSGTAGGAAPSPGAPFQAAFRTWASCTSPPRGSDGSGGGSPAAMRWSAAADPRGGGGGAAAADARGYALRLTERQLAGGLGLTAEVERILQGDSGAIWGLLTYVRLTAMRPAKVYDSPYSRVELVRASQQERAAAAAAAGGMPASRWGGYGSAGPPAATATAGSRRAGSVPQGRGARNAAGGGGSRPASAARPTSAARLGPAPTYSELLYHRRVASVAVAPPKPLDGEAAWMAAAAAAASTAAAAAAAAAAESQSAARARSNRYVDLDMADSASFGQQHQGAASRPTSTSRLYRPLYTPVELPYSPEMRLQLEYSLVRWFITLGAVPPGMALQGLDGCMANLADGTLLAELVGHVTGQAVTGVSHRPVSAAMSRSNVQRCIEALRVTQGMSKRYLSGCEEALLSGDRSALVGLLEDLHRLSAGQPAQTTVQSAHHGARPYLPHHVAGSQYVPTVPPETLAIRAPPIDGGGGGGGRPSSANGRAAALRRSSAGAQQQHHLAAAGAGEVHPASGGRAAAPVALLQYTQPSAPPPRGAAGGGGGRNGAGARYDSGRESFGTSASADRMWGGGGAAARKGVVAAAAAAGGTYASVVASPSTDLDQYLDQHTPRKPAAAAVVNVGGGTPQRRTSGQRNRRSADLTPHRDDGRASFSAVGGGGGARAMSPGGVGGTVTSPGGTEARLSPGAWRTAHMVPYERHGRLLGR